MIRLIIVRHGNTFESGQTPVQVGLKTDLPLTEKGCLQAEYFAKYLEVKNIKPKAVYAGSLKRQVKTAQIVCKYLHIQDALKLNEPALNEIDYGLWEGLSTEDIQSKWPDDYANWTEESRWADGIFAQSLGHHIKAIQSWIKQLLQTYKANDCIIGVTSNGIMRLFQTFQTTQWQQLVHDRNMEKIKVKTGHFCDLLIDDDGSVQIQSWNVNPQDYLKDV
ncbi:MAG: histidine phosphatase family protein [Parachlamydiales bacterium]|nr:histidine phosphatase family protein [Parachlamydiales bacterium]